MPRTKLQFPLVSVEFSCFNCDGKLIVTKSPKLFCSDKCQQEAKFVRYFRRCSKDGRINQADIREALNIRIAHILSGGYKASNRRLRYSVRKAVYIRDSETCQKCGQSGKEIDHINGDSNDLENLQVLCNNCHKEKTKSKFKELTPKVEGFDEKKAKVENLRSRTESEKPQRFCDDERNWDTNRKIIMADLRRVLHNERFLESGRNAGADMSNLEKELAKTKYLWIEKIIKND